MYWKDLYPRVLLPFLGARKIQVSETERREPDGEYRWSNSERYAEAVPEPMWKQMRAILYWIRLLIGKVKGVMWADLGACRWGELRSWSLFEFYKGEPQESIILIKPRENKRRTESFGGFKRKILSNWTDPPDLQVSKLKEFLHLFLQCKLAVKNDTKVKSCIEKWDVTLTYS